MLSDLRFACRMIARRPWFSAAIIATVALGIGANTTVFTLVSAAFLRPVPLPRGERLVVVQAYRDSDASSDGISLPEFLDRRESSRTFEGLEAVETTDATVTSSGLPAERYQLGKVSTGLFAMLETSPAIGRAFEAGDELPGAPPVVLLSNELWQSRFGGNLSIVGSLIRIDGLAYTVIGIMPPGFHFPSAQDLWVPLRATAVYNGRDHRVLRLFGLLRGGVSFAQAQADLDVESARLAKAYPAAAAHMTARVVSFHQAFNGGSIKRMFLILLGAVGFVLLIACANVANLLLSRTQSRSREMSIRAAVGASRWRLVRQLLVECVTLSVLGGLAGLVIAHYAVHAFDLATQNIGKPYWVQFRIDARAYAFFAALSLLTGLIFGTVPAWRSARGDLNVALKDGSGGAVMRTGRLTSVLVVLQFALTVVLLAGAGTMVSSFIAAQRTNPFLRAGQVLTARVSLPDGKGEKYETEVVRRRTHDLLRERLAALPGVAGVAITSDLPGLGAGSRDFEIEGQPLVDPKKAPKLTAVFASPNYLAVIGLPMLAGHPLLDGDGLEGPAAAVVTRSFASRCWPGQDPLGRRFRLRPEGKPGPWITVVGVSADMVQSTMESDPPPLAFFSDRQEPWAWLGIVLRAHGDPAALAASVRSAIGGIDPQLSVFDLRTLPGAIEHEHWFLRLFGSLFASFAATGLVLAVLGIYAVVAQTTVRRTREIGIRIALGASATRVVGLVLRQGVMQMAIGLALGIAGALAALRLLRSLPGTAFGQSVWTDIGVIGLLGLAGLVSSWLPARAAARVQPTVALRAE